MNEPTIAEIIPLKKATETSDTGRARSSMAASPPGAPLTRSLRKCKVAALSPTTASGASQRREHRDRPPPGHIVAYSAETDTYLVAYDSTGEQPFTAWEQARVERAARGGDG